MFSLEIRFEDNTPTIDLCSTVEECADLAIQPMRLGDGQVCQCHTQGRTQQLHERTADAADVQGRALC